MNDSTTTTPPTDEAPGAIAEKPRTLQEAKNRGAGVPMVRGSGGGYAVAFTDAGQIMEFAAAMAGANIMVGPACRNNVGACMAVTMMAGRFGLDPFMLSHKAYITTNKAGVEVQAWEAQAIYAMLLGSGELQETLDFDYEGEGLDRRVIVTGRLKGKKRDQTITSSPIRDIAVKNSPLWKGEPDQQLAYYGSRLWARRHAPHVLMGVYSREEAEEIVHEAHIERTETPERLDPAARLKQSLAAKAAEQVVDAEIVDGHQVEDDDPVTDDQADPEIEAAEAEADAAAEVEVRGADHPGDLEKTKKGALEYARRWAAFYGFLAKDQEEAFIDETRATTDLAVAINPKAEDVISDALNSPKTLV